MSGVLPPLMLPGHRLSAAEMNQIIAAITSSMVGSNGITVKRIGSQLVIGNVSSLPLGSALGLGVTKVETLPDIPTTGNGKVVYWTSEGAGNGNDSWWFTTPRLTEWFPLGPFTALSGDPP